MQKCATASHLYFFRGNFPLCWTMLVTKSVSHSHSLVENQQIIQSFLHGEISKTIFLFQGPQGEPGPPGQQGNPGAQVSDENVV